VSNNAAKDGGKFAALSPELQNQIFDGVVDLPIGIEEAKELRLNLIEEKSVYEFKHRERFESRWYCLLC